MNKEYARDKMTEVRCPDCDKHYDTEEVESVNIEEDMYGADVMTFICPDCKEEQKSNVWRR